MSRLDLTGSDFSGADLTGARLSGANLKGAVFMDAKLGGTFLDGGANWWDAYCDTDVIQTRLCTREELLNAGAELGEDD